MSAEAAEKALRDAVARFAVATHVSYIDNLVTEALTAAKEEAEKKLRDLQTACFDVLAPFAHAMDGSDEGIVRWVRTHDQKIKDGVNAVRARSVER